MKVGILLTLSFAATGLCQEKPSFSSGVSLVHVDAEVTDGTRTLTGFGKDDFVVRDNGAMRPVLYFSHEQEPLDVILLFDISGSMRPKLEPVAASTRTALAELRDGDRIAIMTFNRRSHVVAPFTADLAAVERSIREDVLGKNFGGGTLLLAGVDDAALFFLQQPRSERRRAIVILTDDYGQRSRRVSTVVHHLWEADASLSGLIVRMRGETAAMTAARMTSPLAIALSQGMGGVAEQTGGDTVKAGDPTESFREIMRRIRQRYSIYYAMPAGKSGEQRKVSVELSAEALSRNPNAKVRARKGYLMPAVSKKQP